MDVLVGRLNWFGEWFFQRSFALLLLCLSVGFLVSSCGADSAPQAAESDDVSLPQTESTSSELADQELVPTSVKATIDETVTLSSVANSLAGLDNYRLSWELSFEGVDPEGTAASWQLSYIVTSVGDPPSEKIEVSALGFEPSPELSEVTIVQIDGQKYFEIDGVGCLSGDGQSPSVMTNDLTDPDSFLAGLTTGQQISIGEMMDGMRVNQYSLDEESLPLFDGLAVAADGTVFLSQEGSIPIQIMLVATGQVDYLSSGQIQDGTLTMMLKIDDINQPLEVIIPEACQGSSIYPMVRDAYQITVLEDLISYQTVLPVGEVVLYYQQEMPLAGWSEAEEPLVLEEMALMSYERDGVVVVIAIDSVPGQAATTSVLITP